MPELAAADVSTALIGLLGTVVGGALTVVANLLIERGRMRREAAAAAERDAREGRRASRLVGAELGAAAEAIAEALRVGRYWPQGARRLTASAWTDHAGLLAATLSDDEWERVAGAYKELARLRMLVADRAEHLAPGQRPPVEQPDEIEEAQEVLRIAMQALADGQR